MVKKLFIGDITRNMILVFTREMSYFIYWVAEPSRHCSVLYLPHSPSLRSLSFSVSSSLSLSVSPSLSVFFLSPSPSFTLSFRLPPLSLHVLSPLSGSPSLLSISSSLPLSSLPLSHSHLVADSARLCAGGVLAPDQHKCNRMFKTILFLLPSPFLSPSLPLSLSPSQSVCVCLSLLCRSHIYLLILNVSEWINQAAKLREKSPNTCNYNPCFVDPWCRKKQLKAKCLSVRLTVNNSSD